MQLDHVQVAIPAGREADARRFFGELLGLAEISKPPQLGSGGCWFQLGDRQLHVGVDPDFRPARKAHVAIAVTDFPGMRAKLKDAGYEIHDDLPVDGRARLFTYDPFGNRTEFIQSADSANRS